jgi:hypothetical protein
MSTQPGESWISGGNSVAIMFDIVSWLWVNTEKLGLCHFTSAALSLGSISTETEHVIQLEGVVDGAAVVTGNSYDGKVDLTIGFVSAVTAGVLPSSLLSVNTRVLDFTCPVIVNAETTAVFTFGLGSSLNHTLNLGNISYCAQVANAVSGARGRLGNVTLTGNSSLFQASNGGELIVDWPTITGSSWPILPVGTVGNSNDYHSVVRITGLNNDPEQSMTQGVTYRFYTLINSGYPSAATTAWVFAPRDANYSLVSTPTYARAEEVIGRVYCVGGVATTVTVWAKRGAITTTSGGICIHSDQLPGVAFQEDTITAASDTWEQLSLTFTPTETGVVEVRAFFWNTNGGSTGLVYFDQFGQS